MKLYLSAMALLLLQTALAGMDLQELAQSMVPKGRVIDHERRDFIIKTPAGSKITVEFDRAKNFKEASGKNLNKGDEFQPGKGLISLSTAAGKASAEGKRLGRSWNLEQDQELGWIYEIESEREGMKIDLLINAVSGEIIRSEERLQLLSEN
jgi:uncharacterized membrane protein YkoI